MHVIPLLSLALIIQVAKAFTTNARIATLNRLQCASPLKMTGQGWGNDDFLGSLGGSGEDREKEKENYEDFKKRREAFDKRQRERMESPAGKKFLQQQQEIMTRQQVDSNRDNLDSSGDFFNDMGMDGIPGREQSRFTNMMQQNSGSRGGPPMMGFDQKLAIPLDDEDGEEEM